MARKIKKGLDYFPFDVDFFQDIRIRKLIKYQGGKAITVYALLLCHIYKNGYYAEWDKELPFIFSEQSGYTEAYIQEVIDCCMNIGLLSKDLFESAKVLTSKGIQERYRSIGDSSRKKGKTIHEFSLIPLEEPSEPAPPVTPQAPVSDVPVVPDKKPAPTKKRESPKQVKGPSTVTESKPQPPAKPYSATIEEEISEMKCNAQWKESVSTRYGIDIDKVDYFLDDFSLKCHKSHTSLQDAKSNFCYWLQIQLDKPAMAKEKAKAPVKPVTVDISSIDRQMEIRKKKSQEDKKESTDSLIRRMGYNPAKVTLAQALNPGWRENNPPTEKPLQN